VSQRHQTFRFFFSTVCCMKIWNRKWNGYPSNTSEVCNICMAVCSRPAVRSAHFLKPTDVCKSTTFPRAINKQPYIFDLTSYARSNWKAAWPCGRPEEYVYSSLGSSKCWVQISGKTACSWLRSVHASKRGGSISTDITTPSTFFTTHYSLIIMIIILSLYGHFIPYSN